MDDREIERTLDQVKDKLVAEDMDIKNVEGRVISVVNDEISKRSGGIMMSPTDAGALSYEGEYYNVEELVEAIKEYVENKEKKASTFKRKGKVAIDQEAVDKTIHEASILYVEKQLNRGNGSFYGVSRSNENSDEMKKTGGLITSVGVKVKEGQYISEDGARAMLDGLIEIPTEEELIEAVKRVPEQEEKTTLVNRKRLSPEVLDRLKRYAKRAGAIIGIGLVMITSDPAIIGGEDIYPNEPSYTTEQMDENPKDEIETMLAEEEEIGNADLEIGDIVELRDGVKFDHNSQGDDGLSGVIGEGIREAGDYTVDVIAILDENGKIIDFVAHQQGSLEHLLEDNGYTMEDVKSGRINVRYNISEGINPDLDRSEAAGYVDYDQENYHDKGNVFHDNIEELNGGKNI